MNPILINWSKVLSKFISIQILTQALGAISGILIIRLLDKQEYAYFTIANSMLGAMTTLADGGIDSALLFIGGQIWKEPHEFSRLIHTGLKLRRFQAIIVIIVIVPILGWLLIHNGASPFYTVCVIVAVLLGVNALLTTGVLGVVLRLHSQINQIQNLALISTVSKLVLLGISSLIFLNSLIAVLIGSIAQILESFIIRYWVSDKINVDTQADNRYQKQIVTVVRHQLPNVIFYVVKGQLTLFLISFFGGVQNIADVGALSRLTILVAIITPVIDKILIPRFARCQSSINLYQQYWQIIGFFLLFGCSLVLLCTIFPDKILWVLGKNYSHLKNELILMSIGLVFNLLTGVMYAINASKNWIRYSWLNISSTICSQIFLIAVLDVSTVTGIIWFGILTNIPQFLLNGYLAYQGFQQYEWSD